MHDYMDYCLRCYLRETGWNSHNQYSNLRAPARAILDFNIPHGLSFHAGRAPSDWLKSAHSFQPLPRMTGSIGYMYTSKRLSADPQHVMGLTEVAEGFQTINSLDNSLGKSLTMTAPTIDKASLAETIQWSGDPDFFLYGRMFFPTGVLEAMMARRTTISTQYVLTGLSSSDPRDPIQLTMQWWHDRGPWCTEVSYSTDDSMIGLRGLYNFKWPNLPSKANHLFSTGDHINGNSTSGNNSNSNSNDGIWSAGAEVYYSAKEKSGGVSTGLRYRATQPFIFEVTNIINPAMGYTSTAYTAAVNEQLTCSTRFDFNLYSYESDLCIGAEWRNGGEGVVKGRFGFRQVNN
ncbi:hypothetical protein BDF19DRAFT_382944 [Syncephalis fuscata]|nr:hypothetical protein BDF19DRAFT_382944 [Syncephalis fuscata]